MSVSFLHAGEQFKLEHATLEYLSDLEPTFEWERRGFKASTFDRESLADMHGSICHQLRSELRQSGELNDRIEDFKHDALEIYEDLRRSRVDQALGPLNDRPFYFIIGGPRTGGTYMTRELFRLNNANITNFNKKMTGDEMPATSSFVNTEESDEKLKRLYFGLAQWLLWCRRELADLSFIPKKQWAFAQGLPIIDSIFGYRSTYIITQRHPGKAFESYKARFLPENGEMPFRFEGWKQVVTKRSNVTEAQWRGFNLQEKFLFYWTVTYLELMSHESLKGTMVPLVFGREYEEYVRELAEHYDRSIEPTPFDPSDRTLESFWTSDRAKPLLDQIRSSWKDRCGSIPFE